MIYHKKEPTVELSRFIKNFWMYDSDDDSTINSEKIIPDGYPEIVFNYKEPHKININGSWEKKSNQLIVGQIKNHFYVENMGKSGIFCIKFQPTALRILFGVDMHEITNKISDLDSFIIEIFSDLIELLERRESSFDDLITKAENILSTNFALKNYVISANEKAIQILHARKGLIKFSDLYELAGVTEKGLERFCKNHIGLSPKFYSRIIRFSYIFQLAQKQNNNWQDITFLAGFYDQSHFIKNFKEFTGEDPTKYGFSKQNITNLLFPD